MCKEKDPFITPTDPALQRIRYNATHGRAILERIEKEGTPEELASHVILYGYPGYDETAEKLGLIMPGIILFDGRKILSYYDYINNSNWKKRLAELSGDEAVLASMDSVQKMDPDSSRPVDPYLNELFYGDVDLSRMDNAAINERKFKVFTNIGVALFRDACIVHSCGATVTSHELYDAYRKFCNTMHYLTKNQEDFAKNYIIKNLPKQCVNNAVVFKDIKLVEADDDFVSEHSY